jgi:hypothetical protein
MSIAPPTSRIDDAQLHKIRLHLLRGRGWRYLRHVHLRHFVREHLQSLRTVCVCGAGMAFSELALAIEFPSVEFHVTDIVAPPTRPNYFAVMDLVMRWSVRNVRFGVWNCLEPAPRKFDAVVSTEVLEHIRESRQAMQRMLDAAQRLTYVLVPYADARKNADAEARMQAYLAHEHFVCGFDQDFFRSFEASRIAVSGVYWRQTGGAFRAKIKAMTDAELEGAFASLEQLAEGDISSSPPETGKCAGLKAVLSA